MTCECGHHESNTTPFGHFCVECEKRLFEIEGLTDSRPVPACSGSIPEAGTGSRFEGEKT